VRIWISFSAGDKSTNLHSVKLMVEAMQEELSMVTNSYSAIESDSEPMLVMLVTHSLSDDKSQTSPRKYCNPTLGSCIDHLHEAHSPPLSPPPSPAPD
jgi:hypothetical protein